MLDPLLMTGGGTPPPKSRKMAIFRKKTQKNPRLLPRIGGQNLDFPGDPRENGKMALFWAIFKGTPKNVQNPFKTGQNRVILA